MDQTSPFLTNPPQQIVSKNSNKSKRPVLILGLIILVVITTVISYFIAKNFLPQPGKNSLQDNPFTQIIPNFYGKIEKINGDIVEILDESDQKTTRQISINPETKVTVMPISIPYSVKLATPSAKTATPGDLKIGQRVWVNLKLQGNSGLKPLDADEITVSPKPGIFELTIGEVLEDRTLNATSTSGALPEQRKYKIIVDKDAEIVNSNIYDDSSKPTKKSQLPFSALKAGQQIVVYTGDSLASETLQVLKVDIIPSRP